MALCSVCKHEDIKAINSLLTKGASIRDVSRQYSVTRPSVDRHKRNHLEKKILAANKRAEEKTILSAQGILEESQGLFNKMKGLLEDLEEKGTDSELTMKAHRECNRSLELLARLCGQLETVQTINVFLNPIFLGVRTKLIKALSDYPEARAEVIKAITDPDGEDDFVEDIEATLLPDASSNPTE